MARFRKKPIVTEARQVTRESGERVAAWCGGRWSCFSGYDVHEEDLSHISILTNDSLMRADLGDWVIQGVKGGFYPCKPDIFAATYERA